MILMSNKTIAVDFDGTLCYSHWPGTGEPNTELIEDLITRRGMGDRLILWTCREGEALKTAIAWCKEHGLSFDAVNENLPDVISLFGNDSRKISCDLYIDDKSWLPDRRLDLTREVFI